ncbi:unnamed protein product [Triticum turgidum subsp. durum]|uniref:Uncharacterized protein n=1 Tax=Triticum turgidum subsp. durum TaxID=4567 RepID=A0A9R0QUY9_TRITD|nr:unnamed protein product [Triticum turgidum subsp. durum]
MEEASACTLYRCVCCWRRLCSPRIPRVAPGRDYVCIPAGADDSPAWSLLVGFLSASIPMISEDSVLGLHRFRVARSGRILGRSEDALDTLCTVETTKGCSGIASATAALTPDGRSLCLFSEHLDPGKNSATPRAQQLRLAHEAATMSELPRLPQDTCTHCRPVSAAGHLWAPYVYLEYVGKCVLGMQRFRKDADRWEQAGDTFPFHYKSQMTKLWNGDFLQGCAVLPDDTILVSLRPAQGVFLTFNCSDCTWTVVTTSENTQTVYVPILGPGVYIQGDDDTDDDGAVYFLRDNRVYAYKLRYYQDQEDQRRKLKLEPPTIVDSVCPFYDEGYGFLTHLGGRLMCSVWISVERHCSCDHLHAIISTFRVRPTSARQKGIDILHSTCRRLDVLSVGLPTHEFCFLQEYEDQNAMPPAMLEYPTSSPVIESSKMLDCCSNFLSVKPGHYEFEEPPEDPAVQINKDLYIICEAQFQTIVYVAKIENGRVGSHDKLLTQKHALVLSYDTDDHYLVRYRSPPWHLVFSSRSSNAYVVSNTQDGIDAYGPTEESKLFPCTEPPAPDPFSMVLEVGNRIVALSETLGVSYHDGSKWVRCRHLADEYLALNGKVDLSGYAVLGDNSFVVSEAGTGSILMFDLRSERWSIVRHASASCGAQVLNGRSVFVDGFIYTCTMGGILAYELVDQQDDGKELGEPVLLQFSWQLSERRGWDAERMCLDCADKDKIPDAIVFCVVQGEYGCSKNLPGSLSRSHDVHITTVQVKTERTHRRKRRPERIDHVDISTCFIEHDAALVWTKRCFAVESS